MPDSRPEQPDPLRHDTPGDGAKAAVAPLGIDVVSMHYYENYLDRSIAHLQAMTSLLGARRCVLVSNNAALTPALQAAVSRSPALGQVLQHDNTGLEFGAYNAGVAQLLTGSDPDWVVVLNDTFAIHQCFSPPLCESLVRTIRSVGVTPAPVAVGQVEGLLRSYALDGRRTHRWITTNAFALNRAALRALDDQLYRPELDRLVRGDADRSSFFSAELDPTLREHLQAWLFDPHSASKWYGAAPLDAGNAARYARKARCILQEKDMSARLEENAAIFIDIKVMSIKDQLRHRFAEWQFVKRERRQAGVQGGRR